MIARMKKVTIAARESEMDETLEVIGGLGILHLAHVREPRSSDIENLRGEIDLLERALSVLSGGTSDKEGGEVAPRQEPMDLARDVLGLLEQKGHHLEARDGTRKELKKIGPLGQFDPSDLDLLKDAGLIVRFYRVSRSDMSRFNQHVGYPYAVVSSRGSERIVMVIGDQDFDLSFEEVRVTRGLSDLEQELESLEDKLKEIDIELQKKRTSISLIKESLESKREELEYAQAIAGAGRHGPLSYVQGFCPEDSCGDLKDTAARRGWGLLIEDPVPEDDVPTLLRNPKWLRIVEPVFRFMGTVPGYKEYDVSFWFLVSLSLFFAMLVGDGGYGLLFFLGTYLLKRKRRTAPKEPFILLYVFSMSTVVWGFITGTWFGVERLSHVPPLSRLIIPALDSYRGDQDFMIGLCFVLGAIHLSIAHMLRVRGLFGSLRVLGEVGWIFILWFLYFLAGYFVLGNPLPDKSTFLLWAGLILAGLFSNPGGNFIKSSLLGIADLPFNMIRSFSDLVSYLRLFAVGYATLVIAVSFNQMAFDLWEGSMLGAFAAALVLLIGHTLNIMLAAMAVLVHGIRLNMLEFSSHLGMNWIGRPFRPFKRRFGSRVGK